MLLLNNVQNVILVPSDETEEGRQQGTRNLFTRDLNQDITIGDVPADYRSERFNVAFQTAFVMTTVPRKIGHSSIHCSEH